MDSTMIYSSSNNNESKQNVLILDDKSDVKKLLRLKRTGTVVLKQKDGFPITAKLYDVSTFSVRAYIELQMPLGKDYYLEAKVYYNGQHYTFSSITTCSVCSLNGRGFLAEFVFKSKDQNLTEALTAIMKG
jgi:hypothetical protein